jgi:hypothetical protein
MFSRYAAAVVAVVSGPLLALPVAGQQLDEDWLRECRAKASLVQQVAVCETTAHRLGRSTGTLRIDGGGSGIVNVRPAPSGDVKVTARLEVRAATVDRARQVADAVTIRMNNDGIGADGPATRRGESWTVHFDVMVPPNTDLDVRSANGSVNLSGIAGSINAGTTNGSLVLTGVQGEVRATSVNGSVRIVLEGRRWEGAGLQVTTTNGAVAFTMPVDYSAELDVAVTNGRVATTIAVAENFPGRRETTYRTTLGEGGALLRVVTRNGLVTINGHHGRPQRN